MSATQSRLLLTWCVLLTVAAMVGGYLLYTQGQALSDATARLASLEQKQDASDAAVKGLQSQVAGLAVDLTTTQNRLTADEQQLKIAAESLPPDLTALAAKVTPSVLIISCSASIGSGFALKLATDQGSSTMVATAAHVVKGCSSQAGADVTPGQVTVTQAGHTTPATVKSIDVDRDVALLQVSVQVQALEPADAEPKPGQFVMAVGTPLGKNALANSVTQGNVSKVSGEQLTHTANISNGNSGGPLVDRSGRVVAIVVGAFTANDQQPVVENLNVAVRLMALCDSALSGSVCSTLH